MTLPVNNTQWLPMATQGCLMTLMLLWQIHSIKKLWTLLWEDFYFKWFDFILSYHGLSYLIFVWLCGHFIILSRTHGCMVDMRLTLLKHHFSMPCEPLHIMWCLVLFVHGPCTQLDTYISPLYCTPNYYSLLLLTFTDLSLVVTNTHGK